MFIYGDRCLAKDIPIGGLYAFERRPESIRVRVADNDVAVLDSGIYASKEHDFRSVYVWGVPLRKESGYSTRHGCAFRVTPNFTVLRVTTFADLLRERVET